MRYRPKFKLLFTENVFGIVFTFTFTFMHLADTFIQSNLHCIQVTVSTFYQLLLSLGIKPMISALLTPCSTSWATGKRVLMFFFTIGSIAKGIKKKPSKSELQIQIYWHTGKPDGILLRKHISLYFLYFIVITEHIFSSQLPWQRTAFLIRIISDYFRA